MAKNESNKDFFKKFIHLNDATGEMVFNYSGSTATTISFFGMMAIPTLAGNLLSFIREFKPN